MSRLPKAVRALLYVTLGIILGVTFNGVNDQLKTIKNPGQLLDGGTHGKIYLSNPPQWIQTVEATTTFLKNTLKDDELFFALPYDCLYYYLTGKKSPTRQLIFFDHIKIPPEQERAVITELEANKTNYVLISSRSSAHEWGLGTFGGSYCPLLGRYIQENFTPIARFGDWQNEPGWAWNHGTLILKKNHN